MKRVISFPGATVWFLWLFSVQFCNSPSVALAGWVRADLGSPGSSMEGVAIGRGRNDDTIRIYAADLNGWVWEYTYSSGGWNREHVGGGDAELRAIALGDGRNDGTTRVYVACNDSRIYEFSYVSGSWHREDIGGLSGIGMYEVIIGPGRNDDTMRVYGGHYNRKIYEFSFSAGIWDTASIEPGLGTVHRLVIGHGQNDGVNRLYVDANANLLAELSYISGSWHLEEFGWVPGTYKGLALGKGRNDGVNRVYSWSYDPGYNPLYEWTGPGWAGDPIGFGGGQGWEVVIGEGRNDGVNRVYGSADTVLHEFDYQAGIWTRTLVGSEAGRLLGLAIGTGRNDDTLRIYAACGSGVGHIYEYTYVPTGVVETDEETIAEVERTTLHQNFPNPFYRTTRITYSIPPRRGDAAIRGGGERSHIPDRISHITLAIYDVTGRLVRNLVDEKRKAGFYQVRWDGKDSGGESVASGIYFYRLSAQGFESTKKMILLK